MRRMGGILLTATGFLACPCHLITTLPLLISLLAGTALGSFLSRNTGLVYTGAGIYFVVALALGAMLLFGPKREPREKKETTCSTCIPAYASESEPWQSSHAEDLPVPRR
jgi:mercuric ion transport protein